MRHFMIATSLCVLLPVLLLAQSGQNGAQSRSRPSAGVSMQERSAVPVSLKNTGEVAEDLYDAAQSGNWNTARRKLTQLKAAAQKVKAVHSRKAELLMAVDSLESSVRARDRLQTMEEANQITRISAEMSARYHLQVPLQVALLDYYGRRLQVASARGNQPEMNQTARDIVTTWRKIRGEVQQRNAARVVASWDRLVKELQSAQSTAQFKQAAQRELDQVDRLETVFQRSQNAALSK